MDTILDLPTTYYPIDVTLMEQVDPVRAYPEDKPLKVIYVAGKYNDERGEWYVECNIREAERAAQFIWINGGVAICPHLNTKMFGGLCSYETWIQGDLEILSRCDAIYMLPNWIASEGAKQELEFAMKHNIPVLYDNKDLLQFLGVIE
jgi:hypothetical protein